MVVTYARIGYVEDGVIDVVLSSEIKNFNPRNVKERPYYVWWTFTCAKEAAGIDKPLKHVGLHKAGILQVVGARGIHGLRSARIMLPAAVQAGESATLICLYDLEGAPLYSVKWYKGRREFYRFVPKEVPPTKVFPFPGIVVDLSKSNANQVELRDVQLHLSGNFSCEVSADAPAFSTAFVSEQMTVVDLPDRRPIITLEKSSYAVGQRLEANCTSLRSRPVANLTFYVNDVRVPEENLIHYDLPSPPPPPADRLYDEDTVPLDYGPGTAVQGLRMIVGKADFEGGGGGAIGGLRLRCVASVLVYHTSTEVIVEEERPKLASVLGAREHHPNGESGRGPATLVPPKHHFNLMVSLTVSLIYHYLYSYSRNR